MNRVLINAFHFPPQAGSSGLLRTLKYCRYLPEFGWEPAVLTLNRRSYEQLDPASEKSISANVPVFRAFALDTKRHLGIGGHYPRLLALPDRWSTWILGALPAGLRAIRKHKPDVLYTTFPITSAVAAGLLLHRLSGKPWVLDLRDPMTEDEYPHDPLVWRVWRWIERRAIQHASRIIFTAASTRKMYLERYPGILTLEKCPVISNGYDEEDFAHLQIPVPCRVPKDRPVRLLHSGLIYPEERDPRPMFRALSRLKRERRILPETLQIVFRAPGAEDLYQKLLQENGIADIISLKPHIPYRQALEEAVAADGFLLFQAANCDHQIPAKAYEYLRIGKPIFALTTHTGETAGILREVGGATIANLSEEDDIYREFPAFLDQVRSATHPLPSREKIRRYGRRDQAQQLAGVLAELTASVSDREAGKS